MISLFCFPKAYQTSMELLIRIHSIENMAVMFKSLPSKLQGLWIRRETPYKTSRSTPLWALWLSVCLSLFFLFKLLLLFLFQNNFFKCLCTPERQREIESEWGNSRERRRHRIRSRFQAPNCYHRAQCGSQTRQIMAQAEVGHLINWATQMPLLFFFKYNLLSS